MVKVVRWLLFLISTIFFGCIPTIDRELEEINRLLFLSRNSNQVNQETQDLPNAQSPSPISFAISGLASGELSLQNDTGQSIVLDENGTREIILESLFNNQFSFSIVSQPADHFCALTPASGTYQPDTVIDVNCFSVLEVTPPIGGLLATNGSVVVRFSDSLDFSLMDDFVEATISLTNNANPNAIVSTTIIPNDTLTISPSGGESWNIGGGKFVEFAFKSVNGKTVAAGNTRLSFNIANEIIYVSTTGDNANNGLSPATPKLTVQAAISSCTVSGCLVMVEAGDYSSVQISFPSNANNISLYGSYVVDTNFSERNPSARSSRILRNNASCGPAETVYCTPLNLPPSSLGNYEIDGFTILSADSQRTTGIFIATPNVTLSNVLVRGGVQNGTHAAAGTAGIILADQNITIENSRFEGGGCSVTDCKTRGGYFLNMNGRTLKIRDSIFQGGDSDQVGTESYGLHFTGDTASSSFDNDYRNNQFLGGNSDSLTTDARSYGLYIDMPGTLNATIRGNTIRGGSSRESYGAYLVGNGTFTLGGTNDNDGNTIQSQSASLISSGVWYTGTGFIVARRNQISSGNVTTSLAGIIGTFGMYIQSAGATLDINRNTIQAGNAIVTGINEVESKGIRTSSTNAASQISRNHIRLGEASNGGGGNVISYGIHWLSPAASTISNNIIYGGRAEGGGNRFLNAIFLDDKPFISSTRIHHNTLVGGNSTPNDTIPLRIAGPGSPTNTNLNMQNNILYGFTGSTHCLWLNYLPGPTTSFFKGNAYYNCSNMVFRNETGDSYNLLCNTMDDLIYRIDCVPNANRIDGVGDSFRFNRFEDPMLVNPFGASVDVNFLANPPCRVVQLDNYLLDVNVDFNGNTRPGSNVSIGAIEHTGGCL